MDTRRVCRGALCGLLAALIGVSLAQPADAAGKRGHSGAACRANVEGWLKEGGVDLARVESINIDAQTRSNNDGDRIFQGWQGWVRFKDQEGAIVFSMQRNCQLQHSWTKGDIAWEGPGATC